MSAGVSNVEEPSNTARRQQGNTDAHCAHLVLVVAGAGAFHAMRGRGAAPHLPHADGLSERFRTRRRTATPVTVRPGAIKDGGPARRRLLRAPAWPLLSGMAFALCLLNPWHNAGEEVRGGKTQHDADDSR